jgi:hypothetical protein
MDNANPKLNRVVDDAMQYPCMAAQARYYDTPSFAFSARAKDEEEDIPDQTHDAGQS